MAKKMHKKFLPKVGSTVAVAVAMTVALSTQVSAAELDEKEYRPNDNNTLDESGTKLSLNLNGTEPAEYNESVEKENADTADKNKQTIEKNEHTHQKNDSANQENADVPEGKLPEIPDVPEMPDIPAMPDDPDAPEKPELPEEIAPDAPEFSGETPDAPEKPDLEVPDAPDAPEKPDLEVPDAPDAPEKPDLEAPDAPDAPEKPDTPDAPNTEGMDAEDHNQAAGEYNEEVEDYNKEVEDYNKEAEDYNKEAEDYNKEVEDYNKEAGEYNGEVEDYNKEVEDHNKEVEDYNKEAGEYNGEVEDYNKEVEDYNKEAEEYNKDAEAYNKEVEDYNKEAEEYNKEVEDYNKEVEDYNKEAGEYNEAVEDYNKEVEDYNKEAGEYGNSVDDYNEAVRDYNEKVDDYNEAVDDYNEKVDEYNDAAEKYDEERYGDDLEAYEKAEEAHNQQVKENEIFGAVTEYNEKVEGDNVIINGMNDALESDIDVGVVERLEDVGDLNSDIEVGAETLDVLNDYEELLKQHKNLMDEAAALEAHEGKNAELGSEAYAAYLAAVEAYNDHVAEFNAAAESYNAAVEDYNDAVNAYNADKTETPADAVVGEHESTGTADWGNFEDERMSFNHLDVRYDAAAVKTQNADGSYSDSVSEYDVVGVYYDQATAEENPLNYGVTYTNTRGQEVEYDMMKDNDHAEFSTTNTNWRGEIDRTDASANKNTEVNFYATLDVGEEELKGINVKLDANSVYADNSYYAYDRADHLHEFRDSNGKPLNIVTIDGQRYYDISGQSVYLISALVCDGYQYGLGGLDLILNVETMIEIHQSTSAQRIAFMNYEMGKTAHTYDPGNPGEFNEPIPEMETTARLEKLEHLDKLEEKTVIDFGEPLDTLDTVDTLETLETVDTLETIETVEILKMLESIDMLDPVDTLDTMDTVEDIDLLELLKTIEEMDLIDIPDPVDPPVDPVEDLVQDGDFEIEIPDEEVPLAAVPKTGDISGLWSFLSGISAAGMFLLGRKRKNEE